MADKKKGKTPAKPRAKAASTSPTDMRTFAIGVTAGLGAIAAIAIGFLGYARRRQDGGEHSAPDLAAYAAPVGTERAPDHFRPDPTAPVPASEREALRPATGPGPSMTAMRGEMANQTGAANG